MGIDKDSLYKLPWTKHDNAGGWVEVTDDCDLHCPGCYRHNLEGHRPLADVKADILLCRKLTNCDRMAVAGGEPLLYPHILEVVDFIRAHGMKPVLLANGEKLTRELAAEFRRACLAKYHFHVDSGQANMCDGCMNMMVHNGRLIHSCRLDEHRMFGGYIRPSEKSRPEHAPDPSAKEAES